MKIYLVRHGETDENKETKLMGRTPGNLSETGKIQAKLTGQKLEDKDIKIIYTSPLKRCTDTAKIINEFTKTEILENHLLTERDFGRLTNTISENIDFDALDTPSEKNDELGVEPLSSVKDRITSFLNYLSKKNTNQNILIVCHNNPIRMFLAILLNTTYQKILQEYKINNCGITTFEINKDTQNKVIKVDDVSHL